MIDINVIDIYKTSLNYSSQKVDEIFDKAVGKMGYDINRYTQEENENHIVAEVDFHFYLSSEKFDLESIEEDKNDINVVIEFTHNLVLETDSEVDDSEILYILEPYIRKEIFDTLREAKLPRIPLPYRFWNNEKQS